MHAYGIQDEVKELAFKVGAEIIDAIVPGLAPDLFRMIDINDDGTISAEEWKKAKSVITNPEPCAVVDLLFKLLDKDCSGTVEIDEVISFEKKLVSLAFRMVKTLIPLITTTISTAMASEVADRVFQLLDGDGDGRLTPEEITNNFCGGVLLSVNFLGSAAPLLNEIRAKDDQIAFLEAEITKLGGKRDLYVPMEIVPEFELSKQEHKALFCLASEPPWRMQKDWNKICTFSTAWSSKEASLTRASWIKLYASWIKLAVQMFMTVANLPMIEQHTKDTFSKELNARQLKLVKEVIEIVRPILNANAVFRDEILTMLDTMYDKMAKGEFDKERKGFTDALFDLIDVDKDGKISPAEYAVYTDLFFEMTVDDDGAKAKLMALFNSLDLDKSGCLSKDELSAFMIKIIEINVAYALLTICMVEAAYGFVVDKAIKQIMDFYIKYRVENDFMKQTDMEKMDIAEFNTMLTTSSTWLRPCFCVESLFD
jgi:Ca2+-binding EF-hand superfamily protein